MAKITTGSTYGVKDRQHFLAVYLTFQGKSATDAARMLFDCRMKDDPNKEDPSKVQNGAAKIRRWLKEPECIELYRALVRELARECIGPAVMMLKKQITDENGWLANKASNDVLTKFYAMVMGEDDREIHVKIDGMPTLGEPDADDTV